MNANRHSKSICCMYLQKMLWMELCAFCLPSSSLPLCRKANTTMPSSSSLLPSSFRPNLLTSHHQVISSPKHRQQLFFHPSTPEDSLNISGDINVRKSLLPPGLLRDLLQKGIPPLREITIVKWLSYYVSGVITIPCVSICVELLRFFELAAVSPSFYQYEDEGSSLQVHLQSWLTHCIIRLKKKQIPQSAASAMRLSWILEWYGVQNPMFRNGGPLLKFLSNQSWKQWGHSIILAPKTLLTQILRQHEGIPGITEEYRFLALLAWTIVRAKMESALKNSSSPGSVMQEGQLPVVGLFHEWLMELTPICMEPGLLTWDLISFKSTAVCLVYKGYDFATISKDAVRKHFLDNGFLHNIYFEQMDRSSFKFLSKLFNNDEMAEIRKAVELRIQPFQQLNSNMSTGTLSEGFSFKLFGQTHKTIRLRHHNDDSDAASSTPFAPRVKQRFVDRLYRISPEMLSCEENLFLPEFTLAGERWSLAVRVPPSSSFLTVYLYNQNLFQGAPYRNAHQAPTLKVHVSLVHHENSLLNRCLSFEQQWLEAAYGFKDFVPREGLWDSDYCDSAGSLVLALRVEHVK